ncbi:MAG TPA: CHAT domain-containing tetratricopeptide repeat protein [Blastocatellia bacterium]|nr:CHAT domain-containing tetratricopeptide repeat protein [Blastocatellia bacterium]
MDDVVNEDTNQERRVRMYLLGELDETRQQAVEEQLLADDELFNLIGVVEDELLDEYLDGELKGDELERFTGFFLSPAERRRKLSFAMALQQHVAAESRREPPINDTGDPINAPLHSTGKEHPFGTRYLKMAAGAIILLGLALGIWRVFFCQSEADKGTAALAQAYSAERPIEARLSGLRYAPMGNMRGGSAKVDEISLTLAERILLSEVAAHPGPKAHHALGRYYLTQQKFDKAIDQMIIAETDDQQNAQLQSDLGAALLEKGSADRSNTESGASLEDFARSLEHLNKALSLDGSLLEALFNLALCHQDMLLNQQAREDWQKYLERDPNSSWAEEATHNLRELEEHKRRTSQSKDEVLQRLLNACENRQPETAWQVITETTEAITGRLVWWQLVGAFTDSSANGLPARSESDRILNALKYVGELQQQKTGDGYVSALARFYETSSPTRRSVLVRAHQLMNSGHGFCLQPRFDKALVAYQEARQQYEQAGDKLEAAFADYWIGYCLLQKDTEASRAVFESLIEYCKGQNFQWLLAQAISSFANCYQKTDELSKGIELTKQALQISTRIDDNYAIQKNMGQLANHYKFVGDYQQSFAQLNRSLGVARDRWPGARQMWRTYDTLGEVLIGSEYYAAAADCEKEALSLALEETHDASLTYLSYVHLGIIYERLHNPPEALQLAQRGFDIVNHLTEDPARKNMIAYATVQLGHIYRRTGDYAAAAERYSRAIESRGTDFDPINYDAHKGKLFCYVAMREDSLAEQELEIVLRLTERYRSKILEERSRNKFFDIEQSLFDVAIDFKYSRMHNAWEAFELSESSRARSLWDLINSQAAVSGKKADTDFVIPYPTELLKLQEIMARLPERAQILQYAVLDDKVLIWVISSKDFAVAESKTSLKELKDKTLAYCNAVTNNKEDISERSKELYDILIAPVESLLDATRQICIVPDKVLNYLPFNTLVSPRSGHYLISDYVLSYSPSSNVFLLCTEDAARKNALTGGERLLSVGNPSIDRDRFPLRDLPSAAKEAKEIAAQYFPNRVLVEDDASAEAVGNELSKSDVIHFASHYVVDDRSPLLSKLLLARGRVSVTPARGSSDEQEGVLQAAEIYRQRPLRARLVVLSACQTAIEGYFNGEGAVGMSRTFLAARIPLVVASLWPVDSDSTRELMVNFHRYRKSENPITARALRRAQLDMIAGPDRHFAEPRSWASFIVIGGYAEF